MRRTSLLVFVLLCARGGSSAELHSRAWFLGKEFLACQESIFLSCSQFAESVKLLGDAKVETKNEELAGTWEVTGQGRLRIGKRQFKFAEDSGLFISSESDTITFGMLLVENSKSGRKRLTGREDRLQEPRMLREVAHLYLRQGAQVHDACLTLNDVGDTSSVALLVAAFPRRPEKPEPGIICTWAHCAQALERITGKKCGFYREDWEECLAKSPAPNCAVAADVARGLFVVGATISRAGYAAEPRAVRR